MLNDNENYLIKVCIFCFGLGAISSSISYFFSSSEGKLIYTIICLTLAFCIVWFGKEKVFGFLITNFIPSTNPKRSITNGNWHIKISFDDNSKEVVRTGPLTFSNSLIGVKVKGGKLLDATTDTLTMGGWHADNAELLTYDNHEVLYYLYKIPNKNDNGTFEKIGFVCAVKQNGNDVFVGDFKDIKIGNSQNLKVRTGKVVLNKTT